MTSGSTAQLSLVVSAEQQVSEPLMLVLIALPDAVEYMSWMVVISSSLFAIRGICLYIGRIV